MLKSILLTTFTAALAGAASAGPVHVAVLGKDAVVVRADLMKAAEAVCRFDPDSRSFLSLTERSACVEAAYDEAWLKAQVMRRAATEVASAR